MNGQGSPRHRLGRSRGLYQVVVAGRPPGDEHPIPDLACLIGDLQELLAHSDAPDLVDPVEEEEDRKITQCAGLGRLQQLAQAADVEGQPVVSSLTFLEGPPEVEEVPQARDAFEALQAAQDERHGNRPGRIAKTARSLTAKLGDDGMGQRRLAAPGTAREDGQPVPCEEIPGILSGKLSFRTSSTPPPHCFIFQIFLSDPHRYENRRTRWAP